jgi:hypothetical protein
LLFKYIASLRWPAPSKLTRARTPLARIPEEGGKKEGREKERGEGVGESGRRQPAVRLARAGTALVQDCRFPR